MKPQSSAIQISREENKLKTVVVGVKNTQVQPLTSTNLFWSLLSKSVKGLFASFVPFARSANRCIRLTPFDWQYDSSHFSCLISIMFITWEKSVPTVVVCFPHTGHLQDIFFLLYFLRILRTVSIKPCITQHRKSTDLSVELPQKAVITHPIGK